MATKTDEKWMANYEALKVYIDEHHHLPPKNATDGKWMLNFAKSDYPYEQVQMSHFHELLFSIDDIERFGKACEELLPTLKRYPNSYALKISDNR